MSIERLHVRRPKANSCLWGLYCLSKNLLMASLWYTRWIYLVFLGLCLFGLTEAQDEGDFLSLQRRIQEVYEENRDAVVRVSAAFENAGEGGKTRVDIGTGFFISRDGHVMTNANSTLGADRIWIVHREISYAAEMLGGDSYTNISLLRILSIPTNFRFLHLTDSPELPVAGTMVLRISALLEFKPSPSLGLVTGTESRFGSNIFPVPYIRTDIPGGPGEGGSPLLDLNGKLVGILVYALPVEVQGSYSLPARAALRIRDDLHFSGKINYGWIGIEVEPLSSRKEGSQVVIEKVTTETPAEEAGLLSGDVLVALGDSEIRDVSDVSEAVFYLRENQFVGVRVRRDGEFLDFTVPVIARPEDEPLRRLSFEESNDRGMGEAVLEGPLLRDEKGELEIDDVASGQEGNNDRESTEEE